MTANKATELELISWIEKSIKSEKLKDYKISFTGNTDNCDGYIGDIAFVSVSGITSENKKTTLNWVIKHAKKNEHLRKTLPIKAYFDNEIYFYNNVYPAFKQFQIDKNVLNVFEKVPKCYNTLIFDNMEVIILDNIKQRGFELHDRKKTFNIAHLKTILKEYGKLHAISFALRDQRPEEFNKLTDFEHDVFQVLLTLESLKFGVRNAADNVLRMLREHEELHLLEQLEKLLEKDPADIMEDLITTKEPQSAILHGDSWSNNFMFKYQDTDKASPTDVCIIDWQMPSLRSPAFDLSYLIYATSSEHELDKLEELLQFYYTSFANFLKELGSNPEELFPYSSLKAHWKKYSISGLLLVMMMLPGALCDKDEAVSFGDLQEGGDIKDMILGSFRDMNLYYERIKSGFKCHFEFP